MPNNMIFELFLFALSFNAIIIITRAFSSRNDGRPRNTASTVNSTINFTCLLYNGDSIVKGVIWLHNSTLIYTGTRLKGDVSDRYSVHFDTVRGSVLTINRLQASDAGEFACKESGSETVSAAHLVVLESNSVCRIDKDFGEARCSVVFHGGWAPVMTWYIHKFDVNSIRPILESVTVSRSISAVSKIDIKSLPPDMALVCQTSFPEKNWTGESNKVVAKNIPDYNYCWTNFIGQTTASDFSNREILQTVQKSAVQTTSQSIQTFPSYSTGSTNDVSKLSSDHRTKLSSVWSTTNYTFVTSQIVVTSSPSHGGMGMSASGDNANQSESPMSLKTIYLTAVMGSIALAVNVVILILMIIKSRRKRFRLQHDNGAISSDKIRRRALPPEPRSTLSMFQRISMFAHAQARLTLTRNGTPCLLNRINFKEDSGENLYSSIERDEAGALGIDKQKKLSGNTSSNTRGKHDTEETNKLLLRPEPPLPLNSVESSNALSKHDTEETNKLLLRPEPPLPLNSVESSNALMDSYAEVKDVQVVWDANRDEVDKGNADYKTAASDQLRTRSSMTSIKTVTNLDESVAPVEYYAKTVTTCSQNNVVECTG